MGCATAPSHVVPLMHHGSEEVEARTDQGSEGGEDFRKDGALKLALKMDPT